MQSPGRYSPLGLATLLLDNASLLILAPLAALVISVGFTAASGSRYEAMSSFMPQGRSPDVARVPGLASQLGLNFIGGSDTESLEFYARLAKSRALLEPIARREYAFARRAGGADTIRGVFLDLMDIRGRTEREQMLAALRSLDRMIAVGIDLDASLITLSTRAPWDGMAEQLNRALLEEINRFNLERRQTQAAAERRFAEIELARAQEDLAAAEAEASAFLQHNRRYDEWPQLRFEASRLQRRVEHQQQVYTTLAQRLEQARLDEVRNIPVITVVDPPEGSARKDAGLVRNGILSMIIGAALAVGLLFTREYRRRLRAEYPDDYRRLQERSRSAVARLRRRRLTVILLLPAAGVMAAGCDVTTGPGRHVAFSQVTTGGAHSCAITTEGAAWCWGRGTDGQLGHGAFFTSAIPVQVAAHLPLTQVAAGAAHTCAIADTGEALCWGWNVFHEGGNGSTASMPQPAFLLGGGRYSAITAGMHHTCALTLDDEPVCWGFNHFGQLGDGTRDTPSRPVAVAGGLRFRTISAGDWHTCGVTPDGRVYCWGRNDQGQLGIGSTVLHSAAPAAVDSEARFSAVSAGANHTCALSDMRVWCWGGNGHGQLGEGAAWREGLPGWISPRRSDGVVVPYNGIEAGSFMSCGLHGRRIDCWGRGQYGQLGAGKPSDNHYPQTVKIHAGGGMEFTSVSAGGETHVCALSVGSAVYCWGSGPEGQLGTSRQTFATEPIRVRVTGG
jgi:alpha-tubulin suppressor-like RCC1 family protein/uncharacterized protein involved in exopolysaccharide biosynthesis